LNYPWPWFQEYAIIRCWMSKTVQYRDIVTMEDQQEVPYTRCWSLSVSMTLNDHDRQSTDHRRNFSCQVSYWKPSKGQYLAKHSMCHAQS